MRVVILSKIRPSSQRSGLIRRTNATSVTAVHPFRSLARSSSTVLFCDQIFQEQYSIFIRSLYAPNGCFCLDAAMHRCKIRFLRRQRGLKSAARLYRCPLDICVKSRGPSVFGRCLGERAAVGAPRVGQKLYFANACAERFQRPPIQHATRARGGCKLDPSKQLVRRRHHSVTATRLTS
jgi:hypothetical protein